MRVEVAPGELAHERVGARAAALAGALLELARRDAAEMQVGRELGGAAGEQVVALVVALEAGAQPREHRARGRPARPAERVAPRARARRAAADREAGGEARAAAARRGPRGAAPAPTRGGRARTRSAGGRPSCAPARCRRRTGPAAAAPRPRAPERRVDAPVARHRERRDVGGEVDRARARLRGQRGQLLLRPALAHDEVGAAVAQRRAQLGEAGVQEPRAVAGREAPLQQPRVEHEDRDDAVAVAVGGGEAGWSWTRRSRRNQTRAVVGIPEVRASGRARTYTQSAWS